MPMARAGGQGVVRHLGVDSLQFGPRSTPVFCHRRVGARAAPSPQLCRPSDLVALIGHVARIERLCSVPSILGPACRIRNMMTSSMIQNDLTRFETKWVSGHPRTSSMLLETTPGPINCCHVGKAPQDHAQSHPLLDLDDTIFDHQHSRRSALAALMCRFIRR